MRTRFIVNPGSREGREVEAMLRERFAAEGSAEVVGTEREGQGAELAARAAAAGFQRVVAVGGDGTVNEVVNGLVAGDAPVILGVLPVGTGNDFARSLGMPGDLENGLQALELGRTRTIDLVEVRNGERSRWLANMAAGGFGSSARENLTPELKETWGPFAFFQAAMEHLPDREEYEVEISCSEGGPFMERVLNVAVANGAFVAGGIPAAPYAELDDGVLDLVVVKDCGLPSLTALAPRVLVGKHLEDSEDCILFRQVQGVAVHSDPPMPWNLDGEPFGRGDLVFQIHPGKLEVVVGVASDEES